MQVFIVTDSALGWDCVVAGFLNEEHAKNCVADRGPTSTYSDLEIDDPDYENGVYVG